jgi:hypothetical protein
MAKMALFNPDNEDFEVSYDINHNSQPEKFKIYSKETAIFDEEIAKHLLKHLANKIVFKRGLSGTNYQDAYDKVVLEISVESL